MTRAILILIIICGAGLWFLNRSDYPSSRDAVTVSQQDYQESSLEKTFYGYRCTQDCSGHRAGYLWAEEKDIDSDSDCGGNSESFIEGCWAYTGTYHPSYEEDADASTKPRVRTRPEPRIRDR